MAIEEVNMSRKLMEQKKKATEKIERTEAEEQTKEGNDAIYNAKPPRQP
ncbi:uncharacterized protein G2W53_035042 [Senna tora]|uniref:Uncharacterized protein n=1 Tax=Senna tora TaxID=362788 RepID=A0A834SQQ4_9FABA|nr:uncharacterized protein G2W53_035042 [Senna tora]